MIAYCPKCRCQTSHQSLPVHAQVHPTVLAYFPPEAGALTCDRCISVMLANAYGKMLSALVGLHAQWQVMHTTGLAQVGAINSMLEIFGGLVPAAAETTKPEPQPETYGEGAPGGTRIH